MEINYIFNDCIFKKNILKLANVLKNL